MVISMGRGHVEPGAIHAALCENESRILSLIGVTKFRSVAREFGIPREQSKQVRLQVCSAAFVYRFVRDELRKRTPDKPYQQTKKRLRDVASLARRLQTKVDQFSEEEQAAIRDIENSAVGFELVKNWDHIERGSFGHRIHRSWSRDGHERKTYVHLFDAVHEVAAFGKMISHVLANTKPTDRGGRPRNEAVWLWAVNMQSIWTGTLGWEFTFDAYGGKPISEAARFSWQLLQLVDPDARWLDFHTAMRSAVRLTHPGRGGRRRSR